MENFCSRAFEGLTTIPLWRGSGSPAISLRARPAPAKIRYNSSGAFRLFEAVA